MEKTQGTENRLELHRKSYLTVMMPCRVLTEVSNSWFSQDNYCMVSLYRLADKASFDRWNIHSWHRNLQRHSYNSLLRMLKKEDMTLLSRNNCPKK
uniref:Uncharacterized protein n=1 Tax=Populus trichocarpa TaxID=3694 RepID=A0A2K1YY34_POPTR